MMHLLTHLCALCTVVCKSASAPNDISFFVIKTKSPFLLLSSHILYAIGSMSDLVKTNNEATLSTPLLLLFHYLKSIYITLILYANRVNPTVCLFVCMCICVSRFARSAIKLRANFWRFKGIDQIIKNLSLAYVFCANGEIEGRKPFVFPFLEFSFRIDTSFAACTMSLYAESQSD